MQTFSLILPHMRKQQIVLAVFPGIVGSTSSNQCGGSEGHVCPNQGSPAYVDLMEDSRKFTDTRARMNSLVPSVLNH